MSNLINFLNAFLIYFIQLVLIVAVAGVGTAIGLNLRKSKNAKNAVETKAGEEA